MHFVALIVDATCRYAHVYVSSESWQEAISTLEDIGLEVVENQSEDYEFENDPTQEDLNELGVMTVEQLKRSDAVVY